MYAKPKPKPQLRQPSQKSVRPDASIRQYARCTRVVQLAGGSLYTERDTGSRWARGICQGYTRYTKMQKPDRACGGCMTPLKVRTMTKSRVAIVPPGSASGNAAIVFEENVEAKMSVDSIQGQTMIPAKIWQGPRTESLSSGPSSVSLRSMAQVSDCRIPSVHAWESSADCEPALRSALAAYTQSQCFQLAAATGLVVGFLPGVLYSLIGRLWLDRAFRFL
ncbi:hypothetical protein IFM61392_10469 [Aspergillus lentulus]|uniref:Uncharacterized protein n=1 Tax=Aspergillus lentulus TaxID=293939 RepID=A0AAN5YHJ7_ASPLE|nr:hypothetical protein CNMCM8060_009121 [Aspergillus lentulus]KAF4191013.1 hypothetical protein CNMCM8694_002570 [Aspergillus lentulus]KAF4200688.1 hypothetical protein CNMCM8927_002621 [Aspergillus lentulus]GFF84660.1 hypothetical protein IFM47457_06555 [Aspergillus lentulus]GFG18268.1 hypothetical protein IFM61392_10469 [Aspergillus lentulus]